MQPGPGCRMHGVALHECPLSKLTAHTQLEAETGGSLMADGASRFSPFFIDLSCGAKSVSGWISICTSAANRLIGEVVQSRRRPLLRLSPG